MTVKKKGKGGRPRKEPPGRPTKYDPKYCAMLIEHMAKGYSFETFGPSIDVAVSTTYLWVKEYREFSEAKIQAVGKNQIFWEQAGIDGLYSEGPKRFNPAVWVFNMKNRFGWRDKAPEEDDSRIHTVKIELPGQQAQQVIGMEPKAIEGSDEDG